MPIVLVVFGLWWIGLGAFAIGHVLLTLLRTIAARGWPAVQGEVIQARPIERRSGGKYGSRHGASVRYRYQVAGTSHEGSQLSFWFHAFNRPADDVLARYAAGDTISVAYNPNDPASAVVERGIPFDYLLLRAGLGGAFLAVGIAILNSGG